MAMRDPARTSAFTRRGNERPEMRGEMRRSSPRRSAGMRGAALVLAIVLDAVAFATVLRPRHGYTSTHGLLVALAVGVGVALGALIIAGAAAVFPRRRHRSLWEATTSLPTLSLVLAPFIVAAVGSQIVPALRASASKDASTTAERADFQRWQATIVPIVVTWMDTIRTDGAFTHGLPATAITELRSRVDRSERTLEGLARSLEADWPRLPQRPQLRRLTNQLETGLTVAERAQRTYTLALAAAAYRGVARKGRASAVRTLIDRGNEEAQQSLATMATFSLDANALGGSLFVERP